MELLFLAILVVLMAAALASGFPVAFALPGSAIVTVLLAAGVGILAEGDASVYFAQGGPNEWLSAGVTNFRGVYWEVERDTLIAIPLFVFMGIMLQRSKIAEDLLVTMAKLFGPIPGGLGISVVFVGALLAATTGILGATVVAMGLISLPAMQRNNYSTPLSTGTIAASGTLGQIIPPSIVLIILADQLASAVDVAGNARANLFKASTGEFSLPSEFGVTSTSAGDMFMGALGPGLVLVGLYMLYILIIAIIRPKLAPSVPFTDKFDLKMLAQVLLILVPPLTLIFAVLGSIILGIATVNQAGAIGAVGATIMAGYRLREGQRGAFLPALLAIVSLVAIAVITSKYDTNIRNITNPEDKFGILIAAIACGGFVFSLLWSLWRTFVTEDTLNSVMIDTAKTTSLVFIILLGAAMLTAAFRAFGGEELVKEFLTTLPGGFWMQFIIVMAVIFLLGFFLDFIEIAVVVVPIVAPILLMDPAANITAVWLGVMIGLNIQSSFLTPPFGFALFYLRGVAPPSVKTTDIYKGVVPFIALQLTALVIVGAYPPLVNYLPTRISLTSETAPPPQNPRLQYCLDQYMGEQFAAQGGDIKAAIAAARALDLETLPKGPLGDLADGFDKADKVAETLIAIDTASAATEAAAVDYRPLHVQVRRIERDRLKLAAAIKEAEDAIEDLEFDDSSTPEDKAELEEEKAHLEEELKALETAVPGNWEEAHKTFADLQKEETTARSTYRRTADQAYEPVRAMVDLLNATPDLKALGEALAAVEPELGSTDREAMEERLKDIADQIGRAGGASKIASALRKARKPLRKDGVDYDEVREHLGKAQEELAKDLEWREKAVADVLPGLQTYEEAIRHNIGLRSQSRLPTDQALYVAGCNSHHRDISLHF